MYPEKFSLKENNIDFIVYQYCKNGRDFWGLYFDGFKHGSSTCYPVKLGVEEPSECYAIAKAYKGKPRYW